MKLMFTYINGEINSLPTGKKTLLWICFTECFQTASKHLWASFEINI